MNKSSLENKSLRLWQFLINLSASGGLVPCCWGNAGGGGDVGRTLSFLLQADELLCEKVLPCQNNFYFPSLES